MVEVTDSDLVFSFLEVDEEAILRVHFCGVDPPNECIRIRGSAREGVWLATVGRFVLYLQPGLNQPGGRYPFALLVSVRGRNAITGEVATTLVRNPQNYFSAPPQGGIDGYFLDGQVHPFRAAPEPHASQTRLEIRVFPMKREAMDYYRGQRRLIPGPGPKINSLTLLHGGERQCEPIYEDLRCLGDWDKSHEERAVIWVAGGS